MEDEVIETPVEETPPAPEPVRVACVEDGVVVNVVMAFESDLVEGQVATDTANVGDLYDGEAFSSPEPADPPLPAEVPMHKARKALKRLGPDGEIAPEDYETGSWWMMLMEIIDTLPPRQRDEILDELNTAPNIVLAGATTQMLKGAMSMSDEQLEAVARLALTLP